MVNETSCKDIKISLSLKPPHNCQDVYDRGSRTSGVYKISPDGINKMNVYCEQELDGGGWTVGYLPSLT